ncbi:MAG: HAD family phosphatase [Candidatus Diapherotrites archaeon]
MKKPFLLQSVVFDFDGVIANTPKFYFKHMRNVLLRRGINVSNSELCSLLGYGLEEQLKIICLKYSVDIPLGDFLSESLFLASQEISVKAKPLPGLFCLVSSLKECGVKVGIASNNFRSVIFPFLTRHGLLEYFDVIVSGDEIKSFKPLPDVYLFCLKKLGVEAFLSVAIEDTFVGVESAKSAGLKVIFLRNSFCNNVSLADLSISNLRSLKVEVLKGLFV